MRVVMLSKALVVGAYQKKAEELARQPKVELTVLVPPFWQEAGRKQYLERAYAGNYELREIPMALNGHFHWHFYPGLGKILRAVRPDVLHADEEPYNLATVQAIRAARSLGARTLFFSWQNLYRRLPPPFSLFERYCLRQADYALVGNAEAVDVLRAKGYLGRIAVIPQFGIDPTLYQPSGKTESRLFTIGYLGRLVPQKGLALLLDAVSLLQGDWRLKLVGAGPMRDRLVSRMEQPPLLGRASITPPVASTEVPEILASIDVLVLPSLTCHNWKEQFGRVLVEAMACGVAVVGSDSGEIPNVIRDAGMIFPEGNAKALCQSLATLRDDPALRRRLSVSGRERALRHYTQEKVAQSTARVYEELASSARRP